MVAAGWDFVQLAPSDPREFCVATAPDREPLTGVNVVNGMPATRWHRKSVLGCVMERAGAVSMSRAYLLVAAGIAPILFLLAANLMFA